MSEHPGRRNLSVVDEPARLRFGGHTPYVNGGLVSPSGNNRRKLACRKHKTQNSRKRTLAAMEPFTRDAIAFSLTTSV